MYLSNATKRTRTPRGGKNAYRGQERLSTGKVAFTHNRNFCPRRGYRYLLQQWTLYTPRFWVEGVADAFSRRVGKPRGRGDVEPVEDEGGRGMTAVGGTAAFSGWIWRSERFCYLAGSSRK